MTILTFTILLFYVIQRISVTKVAYFQDRCYQRHTPYRVPLVRDSFISTLCLVTALPISVSCFGMSCVLVPLYIRCLSGRMRRS